MHCYVNQVIILLDEAIEPVVHCGVWTQQRMDMEKSIGGGIRPSSADCLLKTSEVNQMQITETAREFKIVVLTVAEAEHHVI